MINPAIIAVKSPFSGVTPDEIPSAMDRGNAIIATIIPATTSLLNCSLLYPLSVVNNFGLNFDIAFLL